LGIGRGKKVNIETFTLGPVMTNAFLAYNLKQKKGVVVDPGMDPAPLLDKIRTLLLQIEAILLTHAHFDHIGGVEELHLLTKAPVYIHEKEADWLADPLLNGSGLWPGIPRISCHPNKKILKGGETLSFFGEIFDVIYTPGHSPGSVTYKSGNVVFSGDVLFRDSIGRTDLPGGDYDILMQSIQNNLIKLPKETKVMPGHGLVTTVGREKEKNPFLS
jgi:hydroxyacylglutathione hydrolase